MTTRKLTFHTDSGHGWLEVSIEDIRELCIENSISRYSYIANGRVYLEEDCDASLYFANAKDNGWVINMTEKYHAGDCFIRNLPRWNA